MKIRNELKKEAPSILLGLGLAGFFGAIIYSGYVSPEAHKRLANLPPEASRIARMRCIAPTYAPVAGLALASAGAILASNRILKNRYAALLVLYSFTEQVADRWKRAAEEELTSKSFKKLSDKVIGSTEDVPDDVRVAADSEGLTTLYDEFSGRWINTDSVETVRKAINDINERMYQEDFVPLNDLYFALGMDPIKPGNDLGWHIEDGAVKVRLTPIIRGNEGKERPYIAISFNIDPRTY